MKSRIDAIVLQYCALEIDSFFVYDVIMDDEMDPEGYWVTVGDGDLRPKARNGRVGEPWDVPGDSPPVHLHKTNCTCPEEALVVYCHFLHEWRARKGATRPGALPILYDTNTWQPRVFEYLDEFFQRLSAITFILRFHSVPATRNRIRHKEIFFLVRYLLLNDAHYDTRTPEQKEKEEIWEAEYQELKKKHKREEAIRRRREKRQADKAKRGAVITLP